MQKEYELKISQLTDLKSDMQKILEEERESHAQTIDDL